MRTATYACPRCGQSDCRCKIRVQLSHADALAAHTDWGFNCGPAAICALLGVGPTALRPHLGNFEQNGYTNPTLMKRILRGLWLGMTSVGVLRWPTWGVARVQWGGPWTEPDVPPAAAYRHTHWVAAWSSIDRRTSAVFDINALDRGGWLPADAWRTEIVPRILRDCVPRADGTYWLTHVFALSEGQCGYVGRQILERCHQPQPTGDPR